MADDLATVLAVMSALKRERVPFADAWEIAVQPATEERSSLRDALDATADAWRRAYVGAPPATAGEAAAAFLFGWSQDDAAEDRGAELVGVRCG
jgi:hypothetical protein